MRRTEEEKLSAHLKAYARLRASVDAEMRQAVEQGDAALVADIGLLGQVLMNREERAMKALKTIALMKGGCTQ